MSDLSRVEQLLRNALGEDIYEVTPQSRVEVLLVELNELIEGMGGSVSPEDIATAVAAYLDEHLTNPTNPPIDTSLAIAGAAADAKKVGDKIAELEDALGFGVANNLLITHEHKLINYGYDEPIDRKADTTATNSLRVGVKRYNNMVVLNYDGGLSNDPVIRISDSVQSVINNNAKTWNTGGVSLVAGKNYKVTMIRTDAPYEQLVTMSVYRLGEKNSVGVRAYTESGCVRAFTAEEGKAYNICMYIPSTAVLENATYLITLEEDTAESLYIPYIEEKLTADDFMNGYKDLVTDRTHTSTSRLCNKFIRSAKKGDIITYRSPTLQLGIWTVYAGDTEPTAVRSYAISPVNESFALPKDAVEILFQFKKSSGSISVSDYNCDISIFRQTAENVKPHSNIRSVNHRGFQELAPENTLEAFKQSASHGFKWIETDVQFTSDGVPVILHDRSINRTARNTDGTAISGTVNIDSITYEQALAYDFGIWFGSQYAGTKIPTFEETIALCQKIGLKVRIELKSETVTTAKIPVLVNIVKKYGMIKNVEWVSFGLSLLQYISQEYPSYDLGYIVNTVTESVVASATALRTSSNNVLVACPLTSTDAQIQLLIDADIPMDFWTVTKLSEILSASPYATSYTTNRYYVEDVLSGLGFATE